MWLYDHVSEIKILKATLSQLGNEPITELPTANKANC